MKVKLFSKELIKSYLEIWSAISLLLSFVLIFFTIPDNYKIISGLIFVILLCVSYLMMWFLANNKKTASIKINDTIVNVIIGDIFKQDELKVIAFNDFMDTIADDKIVAKETLHGMFLAKYSDSLDKIDKIISNNQMFNRNIERDNVSRKHGKTKCYKLGLVLEYDSYVLTPFTKFNDDNETYLTAEEYIEFWMNFWNNISKIYAGRTINIPLMGAGITRFHSVKPKKQELLETMLWTLRLSGFQCTYNDKAINIVIYKKDAKDINFYHIDKEMTNVL